LNTFHIHITGQVQGVGFRPFVYVLAVKKSICGWVKNTIDGVHIRFNAENLEQARLFSEQIIEQAPKLSIITDSSLEEVQSESFDQFSIIQSEESGKANLLVTPDFAMCPDCESELLSTNNRRKDYPFITCTNCGPRYSIITDLPYDRPYTTMEAFKMCPDCDEEYNDPTKRRYFSQTNSCHTCAVTLSIYSSKGDVIEYPNVDAQIDYISDLLRSGAIIAIKGIGGYLVICDARDPLTVQKLRARKRRPSKAFAMMFPGVNEIEEELFLGEEARSLLTGPVSPIILLSKKTEAGKYAYEDIAPRLIQIGVMIPYTPLYKLILEKFGSAIIATSGNISDDPIVYENDPAREKLATIADYIVTNNRDIVVPQDDSVIAFTPKYGKKIIYRRSRGMAPSYLDKELTLPGDTILAAGGEMKSSFTFLYNHLAFISQYLGDLEDYGTQKAYQKTLEHFMALFKAKPGIILHDLHPLYFSTRLSEQYAKTLGIDAIGIQHHEAHLAAILGEKNLFDKKESILAFVWDGTGYGSDHQIWGGEVFLYKNHEITRVTQLKYFGYLLGDKMPREPRISALAVSKGSDEMQSTLKSKFTPTEWNIYKTILEESAKLKTSSIGRLFDAVASLVLDLDKCSYEGEAAMYLEVAARRYFEENDLNAFISFDLPSDKSLQLDSHRLVRSIHDSRVKGVDPNEIAFRFHCTLVNWVEKVAENQKTDQLAFSGGVFQNALLVDLITMRLSEKYDLHFHQKLSPNDECISFGQLMHYLHILKQQE